MTKVDVAFAKEELSFDIAGEEAAVPDMSQFVDGNNSKSENICTTQTDIISGLDDNSSGPIRLSNLKDNRWKPYDEREKQRLEEQNIRRAILVQKEMLRCGLSLSPFCEPHFDDHNLDSNFESAYLSRHRQISCSSEESSSSPDDEIEDQCRNFLQDTDLEDYSHKSDQDLVKEYMDAEDKVDELQKALQSAILQNQLRTREFDVGAELEKIRVYRKEIEKLTQENDHLLTENRKLSSLLGATD